MEVEVRPELAPTECRALLLALELANLRASAETCGNAWRLAGLREATGDEEAQAGYAFSPRSTRGATRA